MLLPGSLTPRDELTPGIDSPGGAYYRESDSPGVTLKLPTFSKTKIFPKVINKLSSPFMCLFIKNEKVLNFQKKNRLAGRSTLQGSLFEFE